jgi:predicted tellurium resistance membrane protein TerC
MSKLERFLLVILLFIGFNLTWMGLHDIDSSNNALQFIKGLFWTALGTIGMWRGVDALPRLRK